MYLKENFRGLSFKNMTRIFSINARPYRFPSRALSSTLHKKHNELLVALRLRLKTFRIVNIFRKISPT